MTCSCEHFIRISNKLLVERLDGLVPETAEIYKVDRHKGFIEVFYFNHANRYDRGEGWDPKIHHTGEYNE